MNRMVTEFRAGVALETAIAIVALAGPAGWLGGPTAAVGMLAAGGLSIVNFWWLSRAAVVSTSVVPSRGLWMVIAGARYVLLFAAFVALCAGGYAHPVAVVVGLGVLPCALITRGLRLAREADGS